MEAWRWMGAVWCCVLLVAGNAPAFAAEKGSGDADAVRLCIEAARDGNASAIAAFCPDAARAGLTRGKYEWAMLLLRQGSPDARRQGVALLKEIVEHWGQRSGVDEKYDPGYPMFPFVEAKKTLIKLGELPDFEEYRYRAVLNGPDSPIQAWIGKTYDNGYSIKPAMAFGQGKWHVMTDLTPWLKRRYKGVPLPRFDFWYGSLSLKKAVRFDGAAEDAGFPDKWVYLSGDKAGEPFQVDGIAQVENGNCEAGWGFLMRGHRPRYLDDGMVDKVAGEVVVSGKGVRALPVRKAALPDADRAQIRQAIRLHFPALLEAFRQQLARNPYRSPAQAFDLPSPVFTEKVVETIGGDGGSGWLHVGGYIASGEAMERAKAEKALPIWMLARAYFYSVWFRREAGGGWQWAGGVLDVAKEKGPPLRMGVPAAFVMDGKPWFLEEAGDWGEAYLILLMAGADGRIADVLWSAVGEGCE